MLGTRLDLLRGWSRTPRCNAHRPTRMPQCVPMSPLVTLPASAVRRNPDAQRERQRKTMHVATSALLAWHLKTTRTQERSLEPAENAEVSFLSGTPMPLQRSFPAQFPEPLADANGGETAAPELAKLATVVNLHDALELAICKLGHARAKAHVPGPERRIRRLSSPAVIQVRGFRPSFETVTETTGIEPHSLLGSVVCTADAQQPHSGDADEPVPVRRIRAALNH